MENQREGNTTDLHRLRKTYKKQIFGALKTKTIMKYISNYYKELSREEENSQKLNQTKEKIWGVINKIRESQIFRKMSNSHNLEITNISQPNKKCLDRLVIHIETNRFRKLLDFVFNILIFIDLLIMPFEYFLESFHLTDDNTRELIFDSVFLLEILINFFTAYDLNGRLIKEFKTIAKRYLKFNFFLDVIYAFPFWIFYSKLICLRFIKIYRYPSLLKKIRKMIFSMNSFCIKSLKILHGMTEIFIILIHLIFLIHYSGVLYVYIGMIEKNGDNWISKGEINEYTILGKYFVAVYFMVETFISVGYGDFTPGNMYEIIYIMCVEILFAGILAYLLNCMIEVFKNLFIKEMTISNKLNRDIDLDSWIANYNKQISLEKKKELNRNFGDNQFFQKIENYFFMYYKLDHKWIKNFKFFELMRPTERNILMEQVFSNLYNYFGVFFSSFVKYPSIRRNFVMSLEAFFLEHNSELMREHEYISGKPFSGEAENKNQIKYFYFVCNGRINVSRKNIDICEYSDGSYFGDEYFIFKFPFFTYKSFYKPVNFLRLPISTIIENCSYNQEAYLILLKKSIIRMKKLNDEYNKNKIDNIKNAKRSIILKDDYDTKIAFHIENNFKEKSNKHKFKVNEMKYPDSVPNPGFQEFKKAFSNFDSFENMNSRSINGKDSIISNDNHSIIENFLEFDIDEAFSDLKNLEELDLNIENFGDFPKVLKKLKKYQIINKRLDMMDQKLQYTNKKLDRLKYNINLYLLNSKKILDDFKYKNEF